jgi:hypothetical protein
MKIRTGFVSNSSSSSFVAIAREVNISDIKIEDIVNKQYVSFGSYLSEGIDIIRINDENMLKFFKLFPSFDNDYDNSNFTFYEIISEDTIKKEMLEDGVEYIVLSDEKDQHSTYDFADLISKYSTIDPNKAEEIINKMFRERKLERILKDEN